MRTLKESQKALFLKEFQEKIEDLPGNDSVKQKRKEAFSLLQGEKNKQKSEFWHYTNLGRFLPEFFSEQKSSNILPVKPLIENSYSLRTGVLQKNMISGVKVEPFSAKLTDGSLAHLLKTYGEDDFTSALNASFVSEGFSLYCEKNLAMDVPIELQNIQEGGQKHVRFVLHAAEKTKVVVVEHHMMRKQAFVSSVSNICVGDESDVHWFLFHDSCDDSSYLSLLDAEIGKNGKLWIWMIHTGGSICRQELRIKMAQENAWVHFCAVNLLSGQRHSDISMIIDHQAPNTRSYESVRNVLLEKSVGVFQGQINVDQIAQHTDAKMSCGALLLSDHAQFFVKPALEIFADHVVCAHGATISDIKADALFYLMARGIEEKEARALLIKAFISDLLDKIPQDSLREIFQNKIDEWLINHM